MKVFARKDTALKYLKPDQILCNDNIKKFFILKDYITFENIILQQYDLDKKTAPNYYEFIKENAKLHYFMDIEIYKDKNEYEFVDHISLLCTICDTVKDKFTEIYNINVTKTVILESHNEVKRSYHIIFHTVSSNNQNIVFQNVKGLKKLTEYMFPSLSKSKIIDLSVYREGLFRTYLSTKSGEFRPLVKSDISDNFDFNDTFVCYNKSNDNTINALEFKMCKPRRSKKKTTTTTNFTDKNETADDIITVDLTLDDIVTVDYLPVQTELTESDCDIIRRFVRKFYKHKITDIREIKIDNSINCIVVALNDRFCYKIDREHTSNHQYIVIDTYSSKQKCHDFECQDFKYGEVKLNEFPKELNELILKCLRMNKMEQELIQRAIKECKDYITENFDTTIEEIQFDKTEMVFRGDVSQKSLMKMSGKCPECHVQHQISDNGYCLKCKVCKSIFPKNTLIPITDKYKHLNNFFMNYNQLVNNGTVNINIQNNYYTGEEEFSCDVQLDNSIFKNKEMTKLYNQVLDGHKVIKISELLHKIEIDFKYTNGMWYFFNSSIWRSDKESLELRKRILKLSNNFNTIRSHYENVGGDTSNSLVKNIKSLINKLYKPGFEEEIIKGAKMYYNDESFICNLNSKKHLVPFENGVFDLIQNKFRRTKKEDYINLTVNYNFDDKVDNKEVYKFLEQILPNVGVREYILKKMSECLNGDIPNTHFLMFIGDTGANGKSQLLNLMKLTMGDFGEKVEVTLLTRKRNNANEANTEKIKLLHKRFAFLSEPEDGEKINIGLLKELTGSEEIVARGLYQESVSFVLEAKLFLACNELPEIKGEDTALWRRIRVIDFPSRFVDEPKEPGEYKIDRTLPSRMREDITWRQTFMKILIDYYYKDIKEPIEVQIKTNEYRQENNDFYNWLEENLEYKENEVLQINDVCQMYLNKIKIHSSISTKYRKEIEKYIKERYKNVVKWEYGVVKIGEKCFRGWKNIYIKN
jgi:P4 family phage/plasmid primase-like protien